MLLASGICEDTVTSLGSHTISPSRTRKIGERISPIAQILGWLAQLTVRYSKKLMSSLLRAKSEILDGARMSLKDRAVLSEISKAKAKGESPDDMAIRAATDPSTSTSTLAVVAEVCNLGSS